MTITEKQYMNLSIGVDRLTYSKHYFAGREENK